MKRFFAEYRATFIHELIKSFFVLIIAVVAVLFWENRKIRSSISFEKRMEIITKERSDLMENADRFTESWNYISQYTKENGSADCRSTSSYSTRYNMLQRISDKTDLILGNSLVSNEKLKQLHNRFALESDTLFEEMANCRLNEEKYNQISSVFDSITRIYTAEIVKQLK